MNVAIIEDEIPAREHLISLISRTRPEVRVVLEAGTIRESVHYLKKQQPDLIFLDIQLNDGISFDIFNQIQVQSPIVFTTAFDRYTLEAFQKNGIEYLLKPIKHKDVTRAFDKFESLKEHFRPNLESLLSQFRMHPAKKRFTARKGVTFKSIPVEEVAYFQSEHKVTFLVTLSGEKLMMDVSLTELESQVDQADFFRINRKYMAAARAIDHFRSFEKGKLLVILQPGVTEEVIVSQEKASPFKKWLES